MHYLALTIYQLGGLEGPNLPSWKFLLLTPSCPWLLSDLGQGFMLCVLDEHPVGATETALPPAPTCQPHIWGPQPGALPTHISCAVPVALSKRKLPVFMEDGSETHLEALSSSHLQEERDLQRCWAHLPHPPPTPSNRASPRVPPERCTRGRLQELSCQGRALHAMLPRQILALGSVVASKLLHPHENELRDQHGLLANKPGVLPPQRENQTFFNDLTSTL